MTALATADRCRSCRAPIVWARSASSGKHMPLDADPVLDADFTFDAETGVATYVRKGDRRDHENLYRCHFSSCPEAAQHRRPR